MHHASSTIGYEYIIVSSLQIFQGGWFFKTIGYEYQVKIKTIFSFIYYIVTDCGEIGAPNNGEVMFNVTTFGSEAVYQCNEGFALGGNATRICEGIGVWSGEEPTCEREIVSTQGKSIIMVLEMILVTPVIGEQSLT